MSAVHTAHHDERLLELLADRALGALSPEGEFELDRLIGVAERGLDLDCMDRAAAALAVGLTPETDMVPASLRARLDSAAASWEASGSARDDNDDEPAAGMTPVAGRIAPKRTPAPLAIAGWFVAAAAILFAAAIWMTRPSAPPPFKAEPLAAQRQKLIDSAPDLVRIPWSATDDPAASGTVQGEVVWSDKLNRGYMTFQGLAANNPGKQQYQLWIFDKDRDERYPVDGGVFDIPASDETTIVPIEAHLHVDHATLFAVTVEKPGGVVVSSRERLPVVAKPS